MPLAWRRRVEEVWRRARKAREIDATGKVNYYSAFRWQKAPTRHW